MTKNGVVQEKIARKFEDIWEFLDDGKKLLATNDHHDTQVKLWYRGHNRGIYALTPSLFRFQNPDIKECQLFELYAQNVPIAPGQKSVSWETVIRMQHYGIPTRLLDWTTSPYYALYFALMGDPVRPCIYVLNPLSLNKRNHDCELVQVPENSGFDYQEAFFPKSPDSKIESSLAVVPTGSCLNDRLRAQSGRFTVHGKNREPLELQAPEFLFRIVIDEKIWAKARKYLHAMNITPLTLFPDHEGLSQHLRSEADLQYIPYEASAGELIRNFLQKRAEHDRDILLKRASSDDLYNKGIGCCNLDSAYIARVKEKDKMDNWLKDGPPFLFVVGEAGVGKTNFILHCMFCSDSFQTRPHVFFPLRVYGSPDHEAESLYEGEGKLALHLYKIIFDEPSSEHQRDVARKMLMSGDIVLALDGLDELARVKGQDVVEYVIRELDSFIGGSSDARVIISCRDHIFDRLRGIGVLSKKGASKPIKISPFDEETVKGLLRDQLHQNPGMLANIATNPLFYDMIRRAKQHWEELIKGEKSSERLEEIWFEIMLRETTHKAGSCKPEGGLNSELPMTVLSSIGKIAGKMLQNRSDILDIRHLDKDAAQLITQLSARPFAFFEKESEDTYCFSHQSLREFVLSWCVAHEIKTKKFDLLKASSSFDYEGGEFYDRVQRLLDFKADVIENLEELLWPPNIEKLPPEQRTIAEEQWNHLARNLFEMIGELMPDDDTLAKTAVRKALSYLITREGNGHYVTYKTKYNIVRCLERIHYSAPRDPYCKHILSKAWSNVNLDQNHICAHAIRGFHMKRQRPGVHPPMVFNGKVALRDMKDLEHEVSAVLINVIKDLNNHRELPEDAEFLGINCTLALIRWFPLEPNLDEILKLLGYRHISNQMKQNIFYALFRRYGNNIPNCFQCTGVFRGIAPLSLSREKSWACEEAKKALMRLAPQDAVEIW